MLDHFNINFLVLLAVGITAKIEFFNINVLVLLHGITARFQTFNIQVTKYFYLAGKTAC